MKLLSFDVGIKNLSFCLFEIHSDSDLKVLKWDNIDLSENNETKCIEIDKNGLCNKQASFIKDNKCYCLKHSKNYNYLKPTTETKPSFLNKQKVKSLVELTNKYNLQIDIPISKQVLLNLLTDFFSKNCYDIVKKNNASKMDLVSIGRNIQHKLNELLEDHILSIDKIIIENQIGPIANKMKTIQGMIAQYFIMKNNNIYVEFVSATNKLKEFLVDNLEKEKEKLDYKQRKKLGIEVCNKLVCNDLRFKEWETFFIKHNKKDDLSDCFLQGMWFIKNKL
jgi:hypothetical protein